MWFILWLGKSHKDHQINCMLLSNHFPYTAEHSRGKILQFWQTFSPTAKGSPCMFACQWCLFIIMMALKASRQNFSNCKMFPPRMFCYVRLLRYTFCYTILKSTTCQQCYLSKSPNIQLINNSTYTVVHYAYCKITKCP